MSRDLPTRRPGIVARHDGGTHHLFDGAGVEVGALNETAAALWALCDGTTTRAEMVQAVCRACGLTEAAVAADVDRALEQMRAAGLITWTREHGARAVDRSDPDR